MDSQAAADYLGRLLNRPVSADTPLRLSSAQRARFRAWLAGMTVSVDDARLANEFTPASLLNGAGTTVPTGSTLTLATSASISAIERSVLSGVGVDLQNVGELLAGVHGTDLKANAELTRIFTTRELSYAESRPNPPQSLAGIYAAKEAMRKCIGVATLSDSDFQALEVLPDEHGRPVAKGFEVSISHSGEYAVAVALQRAAPNALATAPTVAATHGLPRHEMQSLLVRGLSVAMLIMISLQIYLLSRLPT